MKKFLIALVLLLAVVAPTSYAYLTPYLTLRSIRDAAKAGDTAALSKHVDFPSLRESLKSQIRARLDQGAQNSQNPLAAFGSLLAGAIASPAVDALVTPENVTKLLSGDSLGDTQGPRVKLDSSSIEMGYEGLHQFAIATAPGTGAGFRLILERQGAFSWKLTDIRLPDSWRIPSIAPSPR